MTTRPTKPELVGRNAELTRLREQFSASLTGRARAVLITGEAGIGKSRLVGEMAGTVQTDADVLVGRCIDLGRAATPYGPLSEVLRALIAVRGTGAVIEALDEDPAGLAAIQLLLPELVTSDAQNHGDAIHLLGSNDDSGQERLHTAIIAILQAAAERHPLLVIIEDLHWADEGTLTVLTALLRRITDAHILVIVTMRNDGHRSDPARRFAVESERARVLESILLERLGEEDVRVMIAGLVERPLAPATFEQLFERSEGVPFFVEELVENAAAPLADSLRDVLLARYDRLSDQARSLVRIMSVSQSAISHGMLVQLAPLPETQLEVFLRESIDAGVLAVDEADRYAFRHALLREAVHGELLPGERTRLNRALAEILERIADLTPQQASFPALAFHWEQAKEYEKSFVASLAAMRQARSTYAYAAASHFGEQVLERWDEIDEAAKRSGITRIQFLTQFSAVLRDAGRTDRGLAVVDLALEEVKGLQDPHTHATLLRQKVQYLSYVGGSGTEPLIREGLRVLDADAEPGSPGLPLPDTDQLRAELYNLLASTQMRAGAQDDAILAATSALACAERCQDRSLQATAYNLRGSSMASLGQLASGLADFARAGQLAASGSALMKYHTNYSDLLNIIGRYREAVDVAEAGLAITQRYGVERTTGAIMMQNLVEPLLELGEIERVEQLLLRGVDTHAVRMHRVYTLASRVRALCWRGRADEAEDLLRTWKEALAQTAELERQTWYASIQIEVEIAIARDDFEAAGAVVMRMLSDTRTVVYNQRRLLLEAAWVASELSHRGENVTELTQGILAAWQAQSSEMQDPAWEHIIHGLVCSDASALTDAVAATDSESVPRLYRVIVRIVQARRLVAAGDRTRATALVKETQTLSADYAHATVERRVQELVRALGMRHSGGAVAGAPPVLTPREQQVLDLVAEGLSNRQIGERLYISTKTVSVHVSAVLRKLGVSTRTQAARSLRVSAGATRPIAERAEPIK